MRKMLIVVTVVCATTVAFAQSGTKGNGAPKGKFEKFLLVAPGNPNNTQDALTNFLKNDDSNGRAIFIPVKTTNGPSERYCAAADAAPDGSYFREDVANANLGEIEPIDGVKLLFSKDTTGTLSGIDIVDRDATDGDAEITVPADWADAISIDLFIRVLGKPGGCIGMDAYVNDGAYYFYAGTAVFKRKAGRSMFVDAGDLTDVYYCEAGYTADPTPGSHSYLCADGAAAVEMNVFNDVFTEYFWDINNAGVRVTQVLMRANFPK